LQEKHVRHCSNDTARSFLSHDSTDRTENGEHIKGRHTSKLLRNE